MEGKPERGHPREGLQRLWLVSTLAVGLLMAGATALLFQRSMERAELLTEQAALAYLNIVYYALEDLDRFFSDAAHALLIEQSISTDQVAMLFRHHQSTSTFIQDLVILDNAGQALAWAWDGDLPDLSERSYFTYHLDQRNSAIYVSEPQPSIVYEGDWFISVSRAVRDSEGELLGVAVGMFSTDALRDRLADLLPHEDLSVTLLSRSFRLILRMPEDHGFAVGDDVSHRAEYPLPLTDPLKLRLRSGLDDRARLASFQPLPEYGLIAVASITRVEALDTWRLTVAATVLAWLVFAALSLVLVQRLRRSIAIAQASEARFQRVVENASDLTVLTDANGHLKYVSPNWERHLGHEPTTVIGRPSEAFIHPEDHGRIKNVLAAVVDEGQTLNGVEYRVQHANGSWRWHAASISPLYDAHHRLDAVIAIVRDITESRRARQQLAQMAHEDSLTGLPNRARLSALFSDAMAAADHSGLMLGVLFIDLDRFKPVNDIHGHAVGDQLLIQVAQRIKNVLRGPDTAARFGGDEFLVILNGIPNLDQALSIAQRIIEQLGQVFCVDGHELEISCSIGVAIYPRDGRTERALIQRADQAMYRAKQEGRGRATPASCPDRGMA